MVMILRVTVVVITSIRERVAILLAVPSIWNLGVVVRLVLLEPDREAT